MSKGSKKWLGTLRQWHWMSSAICLVGMLLFAITGITLNHAGQIRTTPEVITREAVVPPELLQPMLPITTHKAPLPVSLREWLETAQAITVANQLAEWSEDEIYLSLPRPGGDAWLSIDLVTGALLYERTDRGWVSFLNDLHKGRNTGQVWFWFIDVFAVACIIFCITGLLLLQRYSGNRSSTWPLVTLGFVMPLILIMLFMH